MKFENFNGIDLVAGSFYLCKTPAFSESGYCIAKAVSVVSCRKSKLNETAYVNPKKEVVLESTENEELLDSYNILGIAKLPNPF